MQNQSDNAQQQVGRRNWRQAQLPTIKRSQRYEQDRKAAAAELEQQKAEAAKRSAYCNNNWRSAKEQESQRQQGWAAREN
ncbi:hypothetical protein ISX56_25280 [Serratia ureilytica]|nr:hypothetical protein [Serratia ureilytica]